MVGEVGIKRFSEAGVYIKTAEKNKMKKGMEKNRTKKGTGFKL